MKHAALIFATVLIGAGPYPTEPHSSPSPVATYNAQPTLSDLRQRLNQATSLKSISDDRILLVRAELKAIEDAQPNTPSLAAQMLGDVTRQLDQYQHWLSMADSENRIYLHVGDHVTVAMRDQPQWNVTNQNDTILAPISGVMWIRGIQAVFTAKARGTSSIRLVEQVPKGMARASRVVTFYVRVI